jgi:hypothetical protein
MKLIALSAIALGMVSSASSAQDTGEGFKNWGQCNLVLAHYFIQDWKADETRENGARHGGYVWKFTCEKIGDRYYIVEV